MRPARLLDPDSRGRAAEGHTRADEAIVVAVLAQFKLGTVTPYRTDLQLIAATQLLKSIRVVRTIYQQVQPVVITLLQKSSPVASLAAGVDILELVVGTLLREHHLIGQ